MIYLDNAATTFPKPYSVIRGVDEAMRSFSANPGRAGHRLAVRASSEVYSCREEAARLFSFDSPERVVFTANCTHSLNYCIKAFFRPGCNMVCSGMEHNAVMRPLNKLAARNAELRIAMPGKTDAETVTAFERLIDGKTSLVVCTHASNVTGKIMPVAEIGALCRKKHVPFCVDAAQTAGVLPIDIHKMNIDFLCAPGHKGLYGPMGTGLLVCAGDLPDTLIEGGTGNMSQSLFQPDLLPEMLESGTVNLPGIAGLKAGIRTVRERTEKIIFEHENNLVKKYIEIFENEKNITVYREGSAENYVPLFSFNISNSPSENTARFLSENGIAVRSGLHCAPSAHALIGTLKTGTVRISTGIFNNAKEIPAVFSTVLKAAKQ